MSTDHWTVNPDHPTFQAALKLACPLCKAEPGQLCQTIMKNPLKRRLHHARHEAR